MRVGAPVGVPVGLALCVTTKRGVPTRGVVALAVTPERAAIPEEAAVRLAPNEPPVMAVVSALEREAKAFAGLLMPVCCVITEI